ncbi:zinc metallopeptidase [Metabacillus sp. 84]|uniref:zinc metallopeptidase n=1 Tax=Metabacillus sp. 84 TaxID=3404705 RepID=UPI003CF76D53
MLFHPLDFLIFAAFGAAMWAQYRVKSTFTKYSEVPVSSGLNGMEAARKFLDREDLHQIKIEQARGVLTDHYDPVHKVIRLSEPVYGRRSISAAAVACHEAGHALQHKEAYRFLMIRHKMFPMVSFASGTAPFLLLAGFFLQSFNLMGLGIILFSAAVAFQLITLPVEFNASSRARDFMVVEGIVASSEEKQASRVLNAAALTYVAAALISLLQLLKFILVFSQGSSRE